MNKRILILNTVLVLLIVAGLGYIGRHQIIDLWEGWMSDPVPESITYVEILNRSLNENKAQDEAILDTNAAPAEPMVEIPEVMNLDVPFTTQSPFAEWTEQDNESCEEAAALTVHYYWQQKTFTKQIAQDELQAIVDFENGYFGFYKDTTAAQTAEFIKELWGYERVDVEYGITVEDIKREVAQGRPVILPTAGRLLGNPNFREPGPLYHMVVVRGWTENMILTNDPGTRKGENYQYGPDVLYGAIHDWNGGDVDAGQKAMIVVWPND
ncbi:MAG: C39 family peptidase [Patescibacteria group bacterium]